MCAFGDPEAKAIVNEIVKEVAVKKGVKGTVEQLVGDDTLLKYVESLRVPDWKLVLFQAMARVSARTWQSRSLFFEIYVILFAHLHIYFTKLHYYPTYITILQLHTTFILTVLVAYNFIPYFYCLLYRKQTEQNKYRN